ncbi:hypothetical protein ACJRO7_000025, partial [Eucalyptus globulus]
VNSDVKDGFPILVLNGDKGLTLLPPLPPQKESPDSQVSPFSSEKSYASSDSEFPFGKWVHVGCQMENLALLRKISLVSTGGIDDGIEGYLYSPKVLHPSSSIEDHYKDSPVHLAIDKSSPSGIEEGSDGIWSIVGGKASCRRNFALDVVLLDAFGQIVNKEMEVVASLLYANSGSLVEKTSDDEAPLLTSYDGIEFDSYEKPSKLLHGPLLLSSRYLRLFHVRFNIPQAGNYPFLEAFSNPIRCISRNGNDRTSLIIWKRPASGILPAKCTLSSKYESPELEHNTVREAKPSPSSKSDSGQISGKVLIYRNPGLHFGDIHALNATYVEALETEVGNSKYAIFFPTSGPRSLADEIAGGDFDGDMYWVSRNPQA